MKLTEKLRTLGPVDHTELKAAVAAVPAKVWLYDQKKRPAPVHAQTTPLVLLKANGWPQVSVTRHHGWNYLADQAQPLMQQIIDQYYPAKGAVIRAVVAKLAAGGVIGEHFDDHPTFNLSHRIHVPLVTNDQVDFVIGGETFQLAEGTAYEISNIDYHSVNNRSEVERIHFVFDYLPNAPIS